MGGDSYVRKYGNPERRTIIIYNNDFVPISYKFIRDILIPDLINSINKNINIESFIKNLGNNEQGRISSEIIEQINKMGLYKIHYETLLSISKEMALQPPHPWFVKHSFSKKDVLYDYKKATDHINKIYEMLETETLTKDAYPIKEAIHHSTSGILTLYGVYMGCGYMSSFYNLVHHIKSHMNNSTYYIDYLYYSSFDKISDDLNCLNLSLNELYLNLYAINEFLIGAHSKKTHINIEKELDKIVSLYTFLDKLVALYGYYDE